MVARTARSVMVLQITSSLSGHIHSQTREDEGCAEHSLHPCCYRSPQISAGDVRSHVTDLLLQITSDLSWRCTSPRYRSVVTDHLRSQLEIYVATWEKAVMVLTVRPIPVVTDHSCCYRSPEGPTGGVRSQAGEGEGGADQTEGGTHQSQTAGFLQCHGGGGHLPRFTLRVH